MKLSKIFLALIAASGLCACGTVAQTAQTSSDDASPKSTIVPRTDPIVIELDSFENRSFGSDRAYIIICDNTVQGQIPTVTGLLRTGRFAGRYALQFEKCPATIYEPTFNKKGTEYNFTVYVDDAKFMDSFRNSDWRLSFTIDGGGYVTLLIQSTSISQVYGSNMWSFRGHVNVERTQALELITKSKTGMAE